MKNLLIITMLICSSLSSARSQEDRVIIEKPGLDNISKNDQGNETEATSNEEINPNFCYKEGTPPVTCGQGQIFNCPLKGCVATHENESFNAEYKDCENAKYPNKCMTDIRSLHSQLDDLKEDMANQSDSSDSAAKIAKLYNGGLGVAGLLGLYAYYANNSTTCPGTFSLPIAGAAAAMIGFMGMQSDQSGSIRKQLEEHVKKQQEFHSKGGWSKSSEVQGLKTQIQYLKQIEMMSKQSMDSHKSHRNFYGVAGAAAAACVASIYCNAADPCASYAVGIAAGGVALENIAYNEGKNSYEATVKAREKAEKLLSKVESLFDTSEKGHSTIESNSGTGQVQNQVTQNADSSHNIGSSNTGNGEEEAIVSFNPDVSGPCVGSDLSVSTSSCKNPMKFAIPIPDTNIGKTLNERLNFNGAASAMSEFAKGNYGGLNNSAFGTDKMGAASQGIFRKVAQRALEINKNLKPATKKSLTNIKNGKPVLDLIDQISSMSPTRVTASASKIGAIKSLGSRLGLEKGIISDSSSMEASQKHPQIRGGSQLGSSASHLSSFSGLSDLEGISVGENDSNDEFSVEKELANLESLTEGQLKEDHGIIHADQKISIFKIITNRYNYMRVTKDFGGK